MGTQAKIPMDIQLALVLLGLVLSVVALTLAYYSVKWRPRQMKSEPAVARGHTEPSEAMLHEVRVLRDEWAKLSVRFSGEGFTEDDGPAFLLAVANALHRFESETRLRQEGGDEADLLTEAQGYVAILGLALSWAEANKNEGMRMRAKELLQHAETILQGVKQL